MLTIVGLIKESTPIGKRDDDTALGVAVYNPKSIVKAILVKTKCLTHEIKHYGIWWVQRQILFYLTRFSHKYLKHP